MPRLLGSLVRKNGKYELRCLYPEVIVCPDRFPGIVERENKRLTSEEAVSAHCYRGHEKCKKMYEVPGRKHR